MKNFFLEKGQGVVEYALLLGVVAILVVGFTTDDGLIESFTKAVKNIISQFELHNSEYNEATSSSNNWG